MGITLDLPKEYRNTSAHLLWVSQDGVTVDKVGLCFGVETGRPVKMFAVEGSVERAEAVIAEKVVPLLKQVYGLGDKPEVKKPPVPEVPVEVAEAKIVAARLKTVKEKILS